MVHTENQKLRCKCKSQGGRTASTEDIGPKKIVSMSGCLQILRLATTNYPWLIELRLSRKQILSEVSIFQWDFPY